MTLTREIRKEADCLDNKLNKIFTNILINENEEFVTRAEELLKEMKKSKSQKCYKGYLEIYDGILSVSKIEPSDFIYKELEYHRKER